MNVSQHNHVTAHVTNSETGFIRQSEDKTDVVGLMNNVEIEPGQGFTIKGNIIRQGSISSTHLYPTDITWRDDGGPMPANLDISNEATNEANDRLKLVQSSYNEETWTHSVPLNTEVDGRNRTVAHSNSCECSACGINKYWKNVVFSIFQTSSGCLKNIIYCITFIGIKYHIVPGVW